MGIPIIGQPPEENCCDYFYDFVIFMHTRYDAISTKVWFLGGPVRVNLRVWLSILRLSGNRKQLSCIICITFFYFEQ